VTLLLKMHFCNEVPRTLPTLTDMPLNCTKHPGRNWGLAIGSLAWGSGGSGRIPANRRRSRPGRWLGSTIGSPRAQGWPKLRRGNRQRGRTARTCGGRRDGRCCRQGRLPACQQAKAISHLQTRGGVGCVGRRRKSREKGSSFKQRPWRRLWQWWFARGGAALNRGGSASDDDSVTVKMRPWY
jgi:hypothetical protein